MNDDNEDVSMILLVLSLAEGMTVEEEDVDEEEGDKGAVLEVEEEFGVDGGVIVDAAVDAVGRPREKLFLSSSTSSKLCSKFPL